VTRIRQQVRREIARLALPVAASTLLQRAVSIVDVFLVGGLGAGAIASVGIAQLLVFCAMTLSWGLSAGTTVVVAQLWGARRYLEAKRTAFQALLLGLGLAVILSALGLAFGPAGAAFLGAEASVLADLEGYLQIIFVVLPFTVLLNILAGVMHGIGDTRTPLYSVVLVNVLHVLIAYPLIYGVWGAPELGINGAAIAIGISEAVGTVFLIIAHRRKAFLSIGRPKLETLREVIRVGLPVFGDRALMQAGQMLYVKIVMIYGTAAYAAHQVGLAIEALSFMPGQGVAIAVTTLVGQSLGARALRRAHLANREANRIAIMMMAAMGAVFFFFPYVLLRLFTSDPEVIALGTQFLKIVAALQIPLAITMVLTGTLKAAGDTRFLLLTTLIGSWGVRVPLAWLLAFVFEAPLALVWSIMVLDWLVRMALLIVRYRRFPWRPLVPEAAPAAIARTE
jgi:putative MATE family efflux protein